MTQEKRTYFINPYTFVPLAEKQVFQATERKEDIATHALLEKDRFTGRINCSLKFITPAVIPGKVDKDKTPTSLHAYVHKGNLAIPGSRIRGHLCNLMKAINSSPVQSYQQMMILTRIRDLRTDPVRKGFIFVRDKKMYIQEVKEEILVAHPDRTNCDSIFNSNPRSGTDVGDNKRFDFKLSTPQTMELFKKFEVNMRDLGSACRYVQAGNYYMFTLGMIEDQALREEIKEQGTSLSEPAPAQATDSYIIPAAAAVCYDDASEKSIEKFAVQKAIQDQGVSGTVYCGHPISGPSREYRMYMTKKEKSGLQTKNGRWVKFDSWSGQDGENRFRDLGGKRLNRTHWNKYHVVNIDNENLSTVYPLTPTIYDQFNESVKDMALLTKERQDKEERDYFKYINKMSPLEPGMFVYFKTVDTNNQKRRICSIGRHYRYLYPLGSIKQRIDKSNSEKDAALCPVKHLSGWADDQGMENKFSFNAMKSRLWVEMAMGPEKNKTNCKERCLRILSSQPPKQAAFYLENGSTTKNYDDPETRIRGRKFYWHDKKWRDKMWDNTDMQGDYAFDNPDPENNKEQWSKAEVLFASEDNPQEFRFTIRVMNLSKDELYLLLTSLVGFEFDIDDEGKKITPENTQWCHKIGHARPFMGTAIINVSGLEYLGIDDNFGIPSLRRETIKKIADLFGWDQDLVTWQKENLLDLKHVKALKRIMHFEGAYQNLTSDQLDARISYPLGQQNTKELTWRDREEKDRPKTYTWFEKMAGDNPLPYPDDRVSQALPVYTNNSSRAGNPSRKRKKRRNR
jgi:CRISPR-associated protein (TIGR03986 family)